MAARSKSTASSGTRSTTAQASRNARKGPVRVWSECSVTVAVSSDPPQFVKFTHGFESMSPSGSAVDLQRTEEEIYQTCEEIVNKRVRRLARVIRRLESAYS